MRALTVVVLQVTSDSLSGCSRRFVCVGVYVFIFHCAPKTFYEYVVVGPSSVIHAYLRSGFEEKLCVSGAGEVASLIAVHYFRDSVAERLAACFQHEAYFQAVTYAPTDNVTGIPVYDRREVEPIRFHRYVRYVYRPDMIRMFDFQVFQEIRVDLVRGGRFAGIRTRINSTYPHLVHMTQDSFVIDPDAFVLIQPPADTTVAVFGVSCVELVYTQLNLQVIW